MQIVSAVASLTISLVVRLAACETIVRFWDGMPFWPPKDMASYKCLVPERQRRRDYDLDAPALQHADGS